MNNFDCPDVGFVWWSGIRTHGRELNSTPVFKTGTLNHSIIHPKEGAPRPPIPSFISLYTSEAYQVKGH